LGAYSSRITEEWRKSCVWGWRGRSATPEVHPPPV